MRILCIGLLGVAMAISGCGAQDSAAPLNAKVAELETRVAKIESEVALCPPARVDFRASASDVSCNNAGRFIVAPVSATEHLGGLQFTIDIINTTAVTWENATIVVRVGEREARDTFTGGFSPGVARRVVVNMGNIAPSALGEAEVDLAFASATWLE